MSSRRASLLSVTVLHRTAGMAIGVGLAFGLASAALAEAGNDGLTSAAGPYLAAIHADHAHAFSRAAEYFNEALASDPGNSKLIEGALTAYVDLGQFDKALPLANQLAKMGDDFQTGAIVRVEEMVRKGDFKDIAAQIDAGKIKVAPLTDGLIKAWAQIGAGDMNAGLATLDKQTKSPGSKAFATYHKALALALAGDYESAAKLLGSEHALTRRGVIAQAQILSQLGRDGEAVKALSDAFGADLDPALAAMKDKLDKGQTLPLTVVTSPADGMAEVFFSIATTLNGDTPDDFILTYARAAQALQPDNVEATLLVASLLDSLGRDDLAIDTYATIPADSAYYHVAQLGRADALQSQGDTARSIEVLQALSKSHPDIASVWLALGDALRKDSQFAPAVDAYDKAISLSGKPTKDQWAAYFSRGIAEERQGSWDKAQADFHEALKLQPDQPQVLNYLGYSYVDRGENLDKALEMIRKAAQERPDDGYIINSLGWAYYRLGRYKDAVREMEKAVTLTPMDSIVTDHLGDVYWAVGRKREARFQWRRALVLGADKSDSGRIKEKLQVGLDQVLKEEGAHPLAAATDGG